MECSYIVGGKRNILLKCSGTPNYITTEWRSIIINLLFQRLIIVNGETLLILLKSLIIKSSRWKINTLCATRSKHFNLCPFLIILIFPVIRTDCHKTSIPNQLESQWRSFNEAETLFTFVLLFLCVGVNWILPIKSRN